MADPSRTFTAASAWCAPLCGAMALAGIGMLLLFALVTVADGLSRSLLGWPIDAVRDLGGLVTAVAISFCFPIAFYEGRNITMHLAEGLFGPALDRVFDCTAALVVLGVMGVMSAEFVKFAFDQHRSGSVTTALSIPTAPFWFVVAACLLLTTLAQGVVAAEKLKRPCPSSVTA